MKERELFRMIVFYGALVIALGMCLAIIAPFWRPIAWAVVLAILMSPSHRQLAARMSPNLAAALSCLLTIALLLLPGAVLLLAVTGEAVALADQFQAAVRAGEIPWIASIETRWLESVWQWLSRYITTPPTIEGVIEATLRQVATFLLANVANIVGNVVRFGLMTSISIVTLFFILRDSPRLLPAIREFIPLDADQTDRVLRRAEDAVYATFYGVVVVATIQGMLGGLAFWLLGLPSPLLWGLVMVCVCMVPLLGAPVVWAPAALSLVAQAEYGKAAILVALGVGVIGTVDNLLRPFIIGGRSQLPLLIVFFSVLGGLLVLGPVGLVLGPVFLTTTLVLLDILRLKLAAATGGGRGPAELELAPEKAEDAEREWVT